MLERYLDTRDHKLRVWQYFSPCIRNHVYVSYGLLNPSVRICYASWIPPSFQLIFTLNVLSGSHCLYQCYRFQCLAKFLFFSWVTFLADYMVALPVYIEGLHVPPHVIFLYVFLKERWRLRGLVYIWAFCAQLKGDNLTTKRYLLGL